MHTSFGQKQLVFVIEKLQRIFLNISIYILICMTRYGTVFYA